MNGCEIKRDLDSSVKCGAGQRKRKENIFADQKQDEKDS